MTGRGFEYLFRTNPTAENMGGIPIAMLVDSIAPGLGKGPCKDLKIGIITRIWPMAPVAGHQEANAKAAA